MNTQPEVQIQKEKYFFYSLCVVALLIPFDVKVTNVAIIISVAVWLSGVRSYFQGEWRAYLPYFFLFVSLYFVNFIGLLHSENMSSALGRLESRLAYLFVPLIVFFSNLNKDHFRKISYSFCAGVLLVSLYCLVHALIVYESTDPEHRSFSQLTYVELLQSLDLHPTYVSLFLSFAIFFLLFDLKQNRRDLQHPWLIWLGIFYFLAYNFLVQSRAPLAAFLLIGLFILTGYLLTLRTYRKRILTAMILIVVAGTWMIARNETLLNRFNLQLEKVPDLVLRRDGHVNEGASTQSTIYHLRSWYCSIDLLKGTKWLTGFGSGDEKDVLLPCYEAHGWEAMASERMNAHNEYLSALLRNGIGELLLMLTCFLFPLYWAIRRGHYLYMAFLLLWLAILVFNTLNLQSAIFFYTLFNALMFRLLFPLGLTAL
jgi:O-antigen ligase